MGKWTAAALAAGLLLVTAATPICADDVALTLIPASGDVSGPPGSTVGWGYTLTNNTSDWLQPQTLSADVFVNGTPTVIFNFPAVAPMTSVVLDFSLGASAACSLPPCGLYELTWDAAAPVGFANNGTFIISSDFFNENPSDPGAIDLGAAPDVTAAYSATVVPEPSALLLLLTALGALGVVRRRVFRSGTPFPI
jgi:hypothetical protein